MDMCEKEKLISFEIELPQFFMPFPFFSGYYEVRIERERFAIRIKEVIELLRSRYLGISTSSDPAQICLSGEKLFWVNFFCLEHNLIHWVSSKRLRERTFAE